MSPPRPRSPQGDCVTGSEGYARHQHGLGLGMEHTNGPNNASTFPEHHTHPDPTGLAPAGFVGFFAGSFPGQPGQQFAIPGQTSQLSQISQLPMPHPPHQPFNSHTQHTQQHLQQPRPAASLPPYTWLPVDGPMAGPLQMDPVVMYDSRMAPAYSTHLAPSTPSANESVLLQAHRINTELWAHTTIAWRALPRLSSTGVARSLLVLKPPAPPTALKGPGLISVSVPLMPADPLSRASTVLASLTGILERYSWQWFDGLLIGGYLLHGLERFADCVEWLRLAAALDPNNVEALAGTASAYYNLERSEEAEQYWRLAVHTNPGFLDATEHLLTLVYPKSFRESADLIDFVQQSLRLARDPLIGSTFAPPTAVNTSFGAPVVPPATPHAMPGFGSSAYCIAGRDNGRMLTLIHIKGTMLYGMKEYQRAAAAFEEAVLMALAWTIPSLQALVLELQRVLIPDSHSSLPILLPPRTARNVAKQMFPMDGELPGLRYVTDPLARRQAVQSASSALLSIAKILQDSMSAGAALANPLSNVSDILVLYYLCLSLQESPSTANNIGILLASLQHSPGAENVHAVGAATLESLPGIPIGSGTAYALAYYRYGLELDPRHVHLHTNLGSLLKDIGQLDLAIQVYRDAIACDGTFDIALTNLANAVKDRGRVADAIVYYRRAVAANPYFAEAVCGLLTAVNSICDWRGRGGAYLEEGRYDQWHVDDNGMLQDVRETRCNAGLMSRVIEILHRQLHQGALWGSGLLQGATLDTYATQLSRLLDMPRDGIVTQLQVIVGWEEGTRLLRLVERSARYAMWRWYKDRQDNCESPERYKRLQLPSAMSVPIAPTVLPFHTFTTPLPANEVRVISQRNAARIACATLKSPWVPEIVYPPPAPPAPHLNVGYVSSDFNNHPLAHLMQSVFGMHNPSRVKAFCYATSPSDGSQHRIKIEAEAPVFCDASAWTPSQLVDQIVADGIHILVNLNGYTRGARNEVFAVRPAPICMSFMGFAGTMNAEWCDYILSDRVTIPDVALRPYRYNTAPLDVTMDTVPGEWVYSENIIYCRDTFFCCDHKQSAPASDHTTTWPLELRTRWHMRKELFPHITDDTVILANFNQLYKIDPTTFRSWLRILSHAPNALLWLLRFPDAGEVNLRRTAMAWAGASVASRIIFTDVAAKELHISRACIADLFLDTAECNAHTTAADILWSGTPMLTFPRYTYKMCSRMGASILTSAFPDSPAGQQARRELIASSDDEYEASAIALIHSLKYVPLNDHMVAYGRLADLRKLLWHSRWTSPLFDTVRWTNEVEDAYEAAWSAWVDGRGGDIYL